MRAKKLRIHWKGWFRNSFAECQAVIIRPMLVHAKPQGKAGLSAVSFSITSDAAWAPGVETREAWHAWARHGFPIATGADPAVRAMPAMQRRRVGFLGRMA